MSSSRTTTAPSKGGLRGNLGVFAICFMVLAASAPLTVVGGPMTLGFALGNGEGLPALYLFTMIVLIGFALGFIAMTPHVRFAGAFYSYVERGVGQRSGISAGYTALLCYVMLLAGVYALMGMGIGNLVATYGGPDLPWWVWTLIGFLVITFIGHRNIEISGRVLAVLLVAEVAIVLVFDAFVVFSGGGENGFSTGLFRPSEIFSGAPGNAMIFALLSFLGIEATAIFRSEAKDPERTVPRALIISLLGVGLFYTVSSWAMASAAGPTIQEQALADPENLFFNLAGEYMGRVGHDLSVILFVTSVFAAGVTFHNITTRYIFTLSNRALLPKKFGATHEKHGSPYIASLVTSLIMAVMLILSELIGLDPIVQFYTWTAALGTLTYGVLLIGACLAVLIFFARNRDKIRSRFQAIIAPAFGLIGLLLIFVLMLQNLDLLVGEGQTAVAVTLIVLVVLGIVSGPIALLILGNRYQPESSAEAEEIALEEAVAERESVLFEEHED